MEILIIVGLMIILGGAVINIYNKLVAMKNNVDGAIADSDVQMKMRFDLVENLVNTVKGYASHEKETLENVIKARNTYLSAGSMTDKAEANNQLTQTLKSLFALSESYPDLKANTGFLQLQSQLESIEIKIASARRYFNATIREYNTALETFPNNIIAGFFSFKNQKNYFATTEQEQKAPTVSF